MIELLTTFGRLNRGDRVRLRGEPEVRKVIAALPIPHGSPDPQFVRLSFGADVVRKPYRELVWLVLSPG